MAQCRQKFVLGLIRLHRCHPFGFDRASTELIRHIASNFGEATEFSGIVSQCCDYNIGVKRGAIFADPKALIAYMTETGCGFNVVLRLSFGDFFGGIKAGEMFPDDVVSAKSLDPLSAGIPRQHLSSRAEQIN